jgi:hypothetical protein
MQAVGANDGVSYDRRLRLFSRLAGMRQPLAYDKIDTDLILEVLARVLEEDADSKGLSRTQSTSAISERLGADQTPLDMKIVERVLPPTLVPPLSPPPAYVGLSCRVIASRPS